MWNAVYNFLSLLILHLSWILDWLERWSVNLYVYHVLSYQRLTTPTQDFIPTYDIQFSFQNGTMEQCRCLWETTSYSCRTPLIDQSRSKIRSQPKVKGVEAVTPLIMFKRSIPSSKSIIHRLSPIDKFHDTTTSNTCTSSDFLLRTINIVDQQIKDWSKLRFLDREKINGF